MPVRSKHKDTRPCQLCHFCVKTAVGNGASCVWYSAYLTPDDQSDSDAPLRTVCRTDGNNFRWKTPEISTLELARWVRDYSHTRRDILLKNGSLIISLISLAVALTTAAAKLF